MSYLLSQAESQRDKEACYAVRTEVFVREQSVPEELELDSYDETALHLMVRTGDGTAVGTARLLFDTPEQGSAKIGRVAVLASHRGHGLARMLMQQMERLARKAGQSRLVLDAQLTVIAMYEKLGYQAHGPVFDDAGIDHRKMTKEL